MDTSNRIPGNANLQIGAQPSPTPQHPVPASGRKTANLEIGAPRDCQTALPQNGAPGKIQAPGSPWHSRGYLPHFESPGAIQHVTFHLADSLPQTVLLQLEAKLKTLPPEKREVERRKRLEAWIDAGHGSCVLRKPAIAAMVQDSLLSFDSNRYRLLAWVVMPNHVHALFEPLQSWTVAKIVTSWKKFTARKITGSPGNANLQIGGVRKATGKAPSAQVWHREYWDRYIRDRQHFDKTVEYIHRNPVKAGFAATAEDWPWSSAYAGSESVQNAGQPGAAPESNDPTTNSQPAILEIGVPREKP